MNTYPQVNIIFPTFNGWQDTNKCLSSVEKLNYPKSKIEVIVIDNGSKDRTVPLIRQKFSWVKIIPKKKNLGFSKAVNLGIKKSQADYILITNNDVIFESQYLARLINFLQKNPRVGLVGGKVYYKHPKKKISFSGARFNFYTGLLKLGPTPNQISKTDWVSGCNLLAKREVFKKIGLFDENFFFYFEDLDLCLRAKKAGYKVIYYPKAILWHGEGAAIDREGWQKKSEFYYQGKTRILFKHATKIQLVSSLLFQFLLGLPFQLLVLKHQNYIPAIKALIKNIKEGTRFLNRSLEEDLRYFPIVKVVKKYLKEKPTILEVGSGDYGLTTYLNYPITGADLKFTTSRSSLITPALVKDTQLPFKDNQFEIVISVDMLEHVPPKDRTHCLSEMLRVAKKHLLIAVPEGKRSEIHDQNFQRILKKTRKEAFSFLEEHLKYGLPKESEIRKSLLQASQKLQKPILIKIKPAVNLQFRTFYLSLAHSSTRIFNKIFWAITPLSFLFSWINFPPSYRKVFSVKIKNEIP